MGSKPTRKKKNLRQATFLSQFKVKGAGSSNVVIEGFANAFTVDRGKDIIATDAWDLENFKKAPIILFNHDDGKPIGRALDVRPTDGGLWIKAKISKSKDPEISRVRDLIEEGILNAFSVGFNSMDEEKNSDGINEIKAAELYETSVVSLPMNQDSLFSVSTKSLTGLTKQEAIVKVLKEKGALVAQAVQSRLFDMESEGKNRQELLEMLASSTGTDMDQLTQILAGNVTPVPEEILQGFAESLELSMDDLKELDSGDAAVSAEKADMEEEKPEDEEEMAMDGEEEDEEAKMPEEEEEEKGSEETDEEKRGDHEEEKGKDRKGMIEVVGILVPKASAETAEEAATLVESHGYDAIDVQDAEDSWFVLQADPAMFVEGQTSELDLGDGVVAIIGVRQSDSEPEESVDEQPVDEMGMDEEETDSKSAGVKQANDDPGTPIPGGGDATIVNDENPHLAQARQTNVLLGVLIEEMRGISQKLDGASNIKTEPQSEDETVGEEEKGGHEEDEEKQKAIIENIARYMETTKKRLEKLGA